MYLFLYWYTCTYLHVHPVLFIHVVFFFFVFVLRGGGGGGCCCCFDVMFSGFAPSCIRYTRGGYTWTLHSYFYSPHRFPLSWDYDRLPFIIKSSFKKHLQISRKLWLLLCIAWTISTVCHQRSKVVSSVMRVYHGRLWWFMGRVY